MTTVANNQRYTFGGVPVEGRIPTTMSNPELQWEEQEEFNIGTDLSFFENKFDVTFDYFDKKTNKMIVDPPIPRYSGAYPAKVNVGNMQNKGFEFDIRYRSIEKEFRYELGANFGAVKNELLSLGGGEAYEGGNINKVGNLTKVEEGEEFDYFFGYQTDGIFNTQEELDAYTFTNEDGETNPIQPLAQPGDVKFVDTNNDGTITADDRVKLGSGYPDFTWGLYGNFEYKGFDLKLFFQGSQGNEVVNSLTRWNAFPDGQLNSYLSRYENRWTPETPENNGHRMTANNPNDNLRGNSDLYVEDGSYARLKNIQIGYSLPQSALDKMKLSAMRIYVSADNVFTITDYSGFDPEIGDYWGNPHYIGVDVGRYPQPKTFVGGLTFSF